MGSIIFAHSAIEAFANEQIPDNYTYTYVPRNGDEVTLNKPEIERLPLGQKLSSLLPTIKSISSPKGTKLWERYLRLKEVRDRLVHLKSVDRNSTDPDQDTIWRQLIESTSTNYAKEAKAIIGHFLKKDESVPRWFQKCPIS